MAKGECEEKTTAFHVGISPGKLLLGIRLRGRQGCCEGGALFVAALRGYCAAMLFCDFFRDGKSQAEAACAACACLVGAVEAVEHVL